MSLANAQLEGQTGVGVALKRDTFNWLSYNSRGGAKRSSYQPKQRTLPLTKVALLAQLTVQATHFQASHFLKGFLSKN